MRLKKIYKLSLVLLTGLSSSAQADSLLDIYNIAKIKDTTVLTSKAEYDLYAEKISESTAALLPEITLTADASYSNISDDFTNSNYGATLSLDQSIYNSSYWKDLKIAEKQATQFAIDYDYELQNLILRVATAYFDVLREDEALKSAQANKRAIELQLEQTKEYFKVGLLAITDVHEAQAEYDTSVADEISAENDLLDSYDSLYELIGQDVYNIATLNINTFSPEKLNGDVKSWRNQAFEHNLELHSDRIAKEIAKMDISLAQAGHKPTLGLTASLDHDKTNYNSSTFSDENLNSANIGLELSVPLYSGGEITSQVKQAQYDYIIASETLTETFRSVATDVSSSFNSVRASISSIAAYEQAVISSTSALEAIQSGFEVGTRTTVDVLDAVNDLYESRNELADARFDYIINMLALKSAAGTLKEQDLIALSSSLIEENK